MVDASQKLDVAVGQIAHQVSGLVQARVGIGAERMGDKLFRSEFRTMEVASRQPVTANVQFAGDSDGYRLQHLVEDEKLSVGDRPSDRNRALAGLKLRQSSTRWSFRSGHTCSIRRPTVEGVGRRASRAWLRRRSVS